jgi:hypothetical protein
MEPRFAGDGPRIGERHLHERGGRRGPEAHDSAAVVRLLPGCRSTELQGDERGVGIVVRE